VGTVSITDLHHGIGMFSKPAAYTFQLKKEQIEVAKEAAVTPAKSANKCQDSLRNSPPVPL
jgi:hypothetical protein